MTCPNPDCHIEMDPTWYADIVYKDVEPPQTWRYWECCRCHQFVVGEVTR